MRSSYGWASARVLKLKVRIRPGFLAASHILSRLKFTPFQYRQVRWHFSHLQNEETESRDPRPGLHRTLMLLKTHLAHSFSL